MKHLATTLAMVLAINAAAQRPVQLQPITAQHDGHTSSQLLIQGAAFIGAGMVASGLMMQGGKSERYAADVAVFGIAAAVPLLSIGLFKRGKH